MGIQKAIGAALASVLLLANQWIGVPEWLTTDWINAAIAVAFPVVVYFLPNRA